MTNISVTTRVVVDITHRHLSLLSLQKNKQLDEYMQLLVNSYNPAAAEGLMCRDTLSVGWDGRVFDCDFNQQLEIGMAPQGSGRTHTSVFDLQASFKTAFFCRFRFWSALIRTGLGLHGCVWGCLHGGDLQQRLEMGPAPIVPFCAYP